MININSTVTNLPRPAAKRIALRVNASAERALRNGHPWIFDQAITEQSHEGAPGDLAVIFDNNRNFLAIGLYDPTSYIRVRILQHRQPATIDENFFQEKLSRATQLRNPLREKPPEFTTNGYRLVHGENDGLPGLVLDRYAETLVLKIYSPAWIPHLNDFCSAVSQSNPGKRLLLRLNRFLKKQPELLFGLSDGLTLLGASLDGLILFQENGITFECDPINGQKTGFFLDQRDNRARVEKISQGKTVLNLFAYTGGFSLYAARGGAKKVVSVDISAPAIKAAIQNFSYNQQFPAVKNAIHETISGDAFDVLAGLASQQQRFDLVIIDPPMFAQNQNQVSAGLAAYRKLTKLGLGVLHSGGSLVQASCSSRIEAEDFFNNIYQAAEESNRQLTGIERTGHGIDHPIQFPEGAYLKCLFATVS